MSDKQRWNRIAQAFQLETEPLPGLPLVEIAGDCRVLIEHHCGVVKYDRQKICIQVKNGLVEVYGCDLLLSQMTKTQLVITGKISNVAIVRN